MNVGNAVETYLVQIVVHDRDVETYFAGISGRVETLGVGPESVSEFRGSGGVERAVEIVIAFGQTRFKTSDADLAAIAFINMDPRYRYRLFPSAAQLLVGTRIEREFFFGKFPNEFYRQRGIEIPFA